MLTRKSSFTESKTNRPLQTAADTPTSSPKIISSERSAKLSTGAVARSEARRNAAEVRTRTRSFLAKPLDRGKFGFDDLLIALEGDDGENRSASTSI